MTTQSEPTNEANHQTRASQQCGVGSGEMDRCAGAAVIEGERIRQITAEGWAGCLQNGMIVDRRVHPDATPIQRNSLLGVPEPQKRPSARICDGAHT